MGKKAATVVIVATEEENEARVAAPVVHWENETAMEETPYLPVTEAKTAKPPAV